MNIFMTVFKLSKNYLKIFTHENIIIYSQKQYQLIPLKEKIKAIIKFIKNQILRFIQFIKDLINKLLKRNKIKDKAVEEKFNEVEDILGNLDDYFDESSYIGLEEASIKDFKIEMYDIDKLSGITANILKNFKGYNSLINLVNLVLAIPDQGFKFAMVQLMKNYPGFKEFLNGKDINSIENMSNSEWNKFITALRKNWDSTNSTNIEDTTYSILIKYEDIVKAKDLDSVNKILPYIKMHMPTITLSNFNKNSLLKLKKSYTELSKQLDNMKNTGDKICSMLSNLSNKLDRIADKVDSERLGEVISVISKGINIELQYGVIKINTAYGFIDEQINDIIRVLNAFTKFAKSNKSQT